MANPNVNFFSLSHVGILDGETNTEVADLFGVSTGSFDLDTDSVDLTGDDQILSTRRWLNKGTLSFTTNYMPLDMFSLIYNTPVTKEAGEFSMEMWSEQAMNTTRPRPVIIKAPGEDEHGNPMNISMLLYSVRFGQPTFDQFFSYKQALSVSLEGDALLSDVDEFGQPFADGLGKRLGRFIAAEWADAPVEDGEGGN